MQSILREDKESARLKIVRNYFNKTHNDKGKIMATVPLIQYADASPEARAVFDNIMQTRKVDDVNNFWKALAHSPSLLKHVWERAQDVMKPGALDALTKELIYIAVSTANSCEYCLHSHTAAARAKGMTPEQYAELQAVIAMASTTNSLATNMQVPVDKAFDQS
jgi:AhpD family alkylhydroperoxidase